MNRVISALNDPEFPMSQIPKTITVKIVTMLEVGLEKPSTLKEVIDHFSKNGYRPLTLEERLNYEYSTSTNQKKYLPTK